jgi:hypothetical protein
MSSLAPQIQKDFSKWLSLPNYDTVDIVAATLLANRLPGKSVWLAIVGPPATGKTEITQALSGCLDTYLIDGIMPATFASGYKQSKNDLEQHGLLNKMREGVASMVIVKDFSTVLQKRSELRGEILSQMRDLYDGEYNAVFGNGVSVNWRGKMGMIVCSTGQYDKEIKSLATFGDRFMVFRPREGKRAHIAERAGRNAGQTDKMKLQLEAAYSRLDKIKLPKEEILVTLDARRMIGDLSDFVTRARTHVSRDRWTREVDELPELEGTARVAVQLNQLARGLMLYFGRSEVTDQDLDLMESLVFSSIPLGRAKVLAGMNLRGKMTGREVAAEIRAPQTMVSRALEDLTLVGIVEEMAGTVGSPRMGWGIPKPWKPFVYRLKKWMKGRDQ